MASSNKPRSLSPAEWEVMKVLWDGGPMAARNVFAALPEGHGWAYKTVKTLLSRLVAKEALKYDQIGNSYLYRPDVARDQMALHEVSGVFQRILGSAVSPVLAHFIEEAELTDQEIRALKKKLDEKRKQKLPGNAKERRKR